MYTRFSDLSDEDLFLEMSSGNNQAQEILIYRYEFVGIQIARAILSQRNLWRVQADDLLDTIDDTIFKAIRYFRIKEGLFSTYCRELLNQALKQRISQIGNEFQIAKNFIYLDSPIEDGEICLYHDIVPNYHELSAPSEMDLTEFIEEMENLEDKKLKRTIDMYLMHQFGTPIREIADKMNVSVYEVRSALKRAPEYLEKRKRSLKLD